MYCPAKPTTLDSYHAGVFPTERKTSGSFECIPSTAETDINLNGSTTYSFQAQAQHHLEFLFLTNDELIPVIHLSWFWVSNIGGSHQNESPIMKPLDANIP